MKYKNKDGHKALAGLGIITVILYLILVLLWAFPVSSWSQAVNSRVGLWKRDGNKIINLVTADTAIVLVDADNDTIIIRNDDGVLRAVRGGDSVSYDLIGELIGIPIQTPVANADSGKILKVVIVGSDTTLQWVSDEIGAAGTGDITEVIAGNGLTGGATSGAATLDVGAGTGIVVNGNNVQLNETYLDGIADTMHVEHADSATVVDKLSPDTESSTSGAIRYNAAIDAITVGDGTAVDTFKTMPDSAYTIPNDSATLAKINAQGITDGYVITAASNAATWAAPTGGSGSALAVEESDVQVDDAVTSIDFGTGFDITESPTHEMNIVHDFTEDKIQLGTANQEVNGALTVTNGGTGRATIPIGSVLLGSGTSAFNYKTLGTSQFVTAASSGDIRRATFAGGTGINLSVSHGVDSSSASTFTFSSTLGTSVSLTSEVTNTLPVANGGTGAITLGDGQVLVGSGTSAVTAITQGTNGQLLIGQTSADPAFTTMSGDATISAAGALTIANTSVELAMMATNSVDSTKIVDEGVSLEDIDDGTATNGQVMTWSDANDTWEPSTPSADIWAETNDTDDTLSWVPNTNDTGIRIVYSTSGQTINIKAKDGDTLVFGTDGEVSIFDSVVIAGLTYPVADGSDGYVMTTDGAGNIAFEAPGAGTGTGDTLIINTDSTGAGTQYSTVSNLIKIKPGNGITITREDSTSYDVLRIRNPLGSSVDLTAEVSDILPVANGGSGAASLTDHAVLLGSGTGAFTPEYGTDAQVLVGQTGADPDFKTISGDVTISTTGVVTIASNAVESTMVGADQINDLDINFGTGTDQVSASDMPNEDIGDISISSGSYTLDANVVESTQIAADQVNDLDINFGTGTDQVSASDMPDEDLGDISISSGSYTLDNDVVGADEIADADYGDITFSGGSATLDAGVVDGAALADQGIKGDDVDSTTENFVFNDAFHVTSAVADSAYITKKTVGDSLQNYSTTTEMEAYVNEGVDLSTIGNLNIKGDINITGDILQSNRAVDWSKISNVICKNATNPIVFETDIATGADCIPTDSTYKRGGIHPDLNYFPTGWGAEPMDSLVANLIGDPYQSTGSGLSDLSIPGDSVYVPIDDGDDWTDTFYVKTVNVAETPDRWMWKVGAAGSWSDSINMSAGTAVGLTAGTGVSVAFAAADGHTEDDEWTIYCYNVAWYARSSPKWKWWGVRSYADSCSGLSKEETIIEATNDINDSLSWEIPYMLCSTQISTPSGLDTIFCPGLFTRVGSDTLPGEAMITKDSLDLPGVSVGFSDPDFVFGTDGNMYLITRPFWSSDSIGLVGLSSPNGVIWYPDLTADTTIHWLTTVNGDTLKGTSAAGNDFLSPSFIVDTQQTYTMWYIEVADSNKYQPIKRTASNFFGPWSNEVPGDYYSIPGSGRDIWHGNMFKMAGQYMSLLVEKDSGSASFPACNPILGLAYSNDGTDWYAIDTVLTAAASGWDDYYVYRSAGVPVDVGGHQALEILYSAHSAGCFKVGHTTTYFESEIEDTMKTWTKGQISDSLDLALRQAGGTMGGNINMNGNDIVGADIISSDTILFATNQYLLHDTSCASEGELEDSLDNYALLAGPTFTNKITADSLVADSISTTKLNVTTVTGAVDVGGATSLEIPNGANPTTDAEGEIAWDTDDDAIELYNGSVSMLIPAIQSKEALIWNPDLITDTIPIFYCDSTIYQAGIKIQSVSILTSVDGAYSLELFSYTAADPPELHDYIDTLVVGASDQRASSETFEDADASSVDVGQSVYILTPATDIDWIKVQMRYYIRENN